MITYTTELTGVTAEWLTGFFVDWAEPLTPEQHLEMLKNSYMVVLAIDDETSQVVGFVNAFSDRIRFAFIPMLEVLPDFQKAGVGTKLMKMMLSKLEHIKTIDLICDPEQQSFYEKFNMIKSHGMMIRKR